MKARGLVRLFRGVWAGWAAAFLLACDAPLMAPASIEVPYTDAPRSCRGDGKWACPQPDPVEPPPPAAPTMDSIWVHPNNAALEVGQTMPYWMVGWFGGEPFACADDGSQFVGRVQLNANWLRGSREQVWTPADIVPPELGGETVVPDLSVCNIHVEIADPTVAEWQPRSVLASLTAWLRELFA